MAYWATPAWFSITHGALMRVSIQAGQVRCPTIECVAILCAAPLDLQTIIYHAGHVFRPESDLMKCVVSHAHCLDAF